MVGMFDAGLRAAVLGGNYDQARATVSEELAEIQALPFSLPSTPAADSVVEIYPPSNAPPNPTDHACTPPVPSGFTCRVETMYAKSDAASSSIVTDGNFRTLIQATVTVKWDGNDPNCVGRTKCYTTTGLVSKGTQ